MRDMTAETTETRTPTLVFVHGSGDDAHIWDGVIAQLQGYSCVALDLPGHGAQAERPGPEHMTVGDYADAVRAQLTREGAQGVCLIGHSLGGAVALRLAVDHPAMVSRLVLVGTGARLRVLPELLEMTRDDPQRGGAQLAEYGFALGHETQREGYLATHRPVAAGILHRDLAACDAFDIREELGRVAQPTLVIVGEEDRLTPPKYATYLREQIADAQIVIVPNAGHYMQVEAPDALAQAIKSWLGPIAD